MILYKYNSTTKNIKIKPLYIFYYLNLKSYLILFIKKFAYIIKKEVFLDNSEKNKKKKIFFINKKNFFFLNLIFHI
jgi:hypothetical protein